MKYKARIELHQDKDFVLASFGRRFAAFILDWIILVVIYLIVITVFSLFGITLSNINVHGIFEVDMEMTNVPESFTTVIKILFGILPVLYFAGSFYFFNGKTAAKYLLGLRVVSLYHEKLGLWHCLERSLGYFASALEGGFGFIQALWNPNRMSLHDKIGETIVISLPKKTRSGNKGMHIKKPPYKKHGKN
jgi:uncharacterized RDD family membrane protein YckC